MNIDKARRERYLRGEISHDEYYRQFAKDRHIAVREIDLKLFEIKNLSELQRLVQADPNLNNIPLEVFDSMTAAFNALNPENRMSYAEGSCVYKTLLRDLVRQQPTKIEMTKDHRR